MCLINYKKIDLSKRENPITCYKVFETTNGTLDSPLYNEFTGGKAWEIGKTRNLGGNSPVIDTAINKFAENGVAIQGWCFHTCKTLKDAKAYRKWLQRYDEFNPYTPSRFSIAKCEIPLDSKFAYSGTAVVGYEDEGIPGYVSEALTVVKLV